MTFIITSHDPSLVAELSSAVLIIHNTEAVHYDPQFSASGDDLSELYMKLIGENIDEKLASIFDQ